jgi:hypothetical protein
MQTNSLRLDDASGPDNRPQSDLLAKALFYVVGDADPALLPRVVGPVTKLGLVPSRLHVSNEDGDGAELTIDLRLADVTQTAASRVEAAMRSIVGVRQVIAVYE